MRRKLLFITLMLAVALTALVIMLWGMDQPPPPPDNYLKDIQSRGVLRVGIDPAYPPFETVRDGQVVGYDAELARALAADISVRVEFVPLALDTQYDALAADKVDVLISALPFVYERQKEVRYSVPYYQAGQVILVKTGNTDIKAAQDLAGKRVGVELGSNADTEARRLQRATLPTMDLRSTYHSPGESLDALVRGEVDAAITDNASAQDYLRTHPNALTILLPPLTDEPYVVAMPAAAGSLAERINAAIERLRGSGELGRMMGGE